MCFKKFEASFNLQKENFYINEIKIHLGDASFSLLKIF